MSLRTLLHHYHSRRELQRINRRKKICRLKLSGTYRLRQLERLEPRLLLTGNAPDALDDLSETSQDTAAIVAVLANDVPANPGDTLRVSSFDQAAHGTVSDNDDGTLTYFPDVDFFGEDHFEYTVSDESGRSDTATVAIDVVSVYYFTLIDFGVTQASNSFGVAYWDSVIKDKYATYTTAGPGGLYQLGGSTVYNYQGITGPERTFHEGEKIIASWYNDGETAITFTPKVSLDDTNRRVSSPAGTWYDMESITIDPGNSGKTTFTIDAATTGEYGAVNVNSNAGSSSLIIDKIELAPVLVRTNLVDYGAQPSEDLFNVVGWETVIKDIYARNTSAGPGGVYQFGGNSSYNYQGITGQLKTFSPGEELYVTYYNDGDSALTFTSLISFDDANRKQSAPDGTWHEMDTITLQSGEGGVTTFTIDSQTAGEYDLVNVNSNIDSDALIFDKLELNGIVVPPYNAVPEVIWSVSDSSGVSPLTIVGDATGTFDPDGTIAEYHWDWGDSSYNNGVSTQHTYVDPGDYTLTLTVTDNGGVDAEQVTITKKITVYDPEKVNLLVDFGSSTDSNQFEWADWDTVIKDQYANYKIAGPDGLYQLGGNASYNYQGVSGSAARDFISGQTIRVTWYNNSTTTDSTFTPKISFDDTDRRLSGVVGTWYDMTTVTVEPSGSAVSEYTFDSTGTGSHSLVNVNSNYRDSNEILIADKIEVVSPTLPDPIQRNHVTTDLDTALQIVLLDTTATLRGLPDNGSLTGDPGTGAVTYTPHNGFTGLDSFAYQLAGSDGIISVHVTVGSDVNIPLLPQKWVDSRYDRPHGTVTNVTDSGDPMQNGVNFQAALDNAQAGEVIVLDAGATYEGSFKLRKKPGNDWIYIESSALDLLPAEGNRVVPQDEPNMPMLEVTVGGTPVVWAEAGAHHYRFSGIKFFTNQNNASGLLRFGYDNGERADSFDKMNHHITFDRVYVTGTVSNHLRHGIVLEGMHMAVVDSHIDQMKDDGQGDAQAILVTNSPGPFKIVNNRLEATGENFLSGGQEPRIEGLVPSDFEFRSNYFFKPDAWNKNSPEYNGYDWSVKNLFELKNAQRVLLDGNVFENSWADSQIGYAILLTPTIQGSVADWTAVRDVTIHNNIVTDARVFVSMTGSRTVNAPAYPEQLERVSIKNNLATDITFRMLELNANSAGPIIDLSITHNTLLFAPGVLGNAMISTDGNSAGWPVVERFEITDNIMSHSKYGHHIGNNVPIEDTYIESFDWRNNVIIGGSRNVPESNYDPFDYLIVDSVDDVGFVNWPSGDYRLSESSNFLGLATDGEDIGADLAP
jgi:PKD repeat protein